MTEGSEPRGRKRRLSGEAVAASAPNTSRSWLAQSPASAADPHLECPICLKNFDDRGRKPKVISCGHSVCAFCTAQLVRGNALSCPICRTRAFVPREGFPTNFSLANVAESKARADETPTRVVCKDCEGICDGAESWVCRTKSKKTCTSVDKDGVFLCPTCCLKNHRTHNIVETSVLLQEQRDVIAKWREDEEGTGIEKMEKGLLGIEKTIEEMRQGEAAQITFAVLVATLNHHRNVIDTRIKDFRNGVDMMGDERTLLKAMATGVGLQPTDDAQARVAVQLEAESQVKQVSSALRDAAVAFHSAVAKAKGDLAKLGAAHNLGSPPQPPADDAAPASPHVPFPPLLDISGASDDDEDRNGHDFERSFDSLVMGHSDADDFEGDGEEADDDGFRSEGDGEDGELEGTGDEQARPGIYYESSDGGEEDVERDHGQDGYRFTTPPPPERRSLRYREAMANLRRYA